MRAPTVRAVSYTHLDVYKRQYQLTPAQAMVAKLPVLSGETSTCSGMAFGFDPYVSEADPYKGAYLALSLIHI